MVFGGVFCMVFWGGEAMSENEKRLAGELYDPMDPEIMAEQKGGLRAMEAFNAMTCDEGEKRQELLKKMLGAVGEGCYIEPPFLANWGGKNLFFGNRVYANFHLSAVDDLPIYVGDGVLFGPNVSLITVNHPKDVDQRRLGLQYGRPIWIEEDAWIGAGAILLPGVRIGQGAIIGAGSVVTKDIPPGVVAVGNPCRVISTIQ